MILIVLSGSDVTKRMFSSFKSRYTTFFEWQKSIADNTCRIILAAFRSEILLRCCNLNNKSPPSQYLLYISNVLCNQIIIFVILIKLIESNYIWMILLFMVINTNFFIISISSTRVFVA